MKHRIPLLFALFAFFAAVSIPSAHAALTDGLVSYWPLNGNANDITPNTNDLTTNGTVTWVAGTLGQQAAQFDGSSGYLSLTYDTTTNYVDNGLPIYNAAYYTICLWVKSSNAAPAKGSSVLTEGSSSGGTSLLQLRTDWTAADSTFSALIDDFGGTVFFGDETYGNLAKGTGARQPFDGTWHHIAWVDSNGVAALYVDGVQDPHVFNNTRLAEPSTDQGGGGPPSGLQLSTFSLGATLKNVASSYFAGDIQDVAIWERNLSQEEISNVMSGGLPITPGSIATAAPAITNQPIGNTNLIVGDNWALQAYGEGTHPRTYQWYVTTESGSTALTDNDATATNDIIFGSQSNILSLSNLTSASSGSYTVQISNGDGVPATSRPATVLVSPVSPWAPNLTNGEISVWPLSTINNGTTPDVVGGYDMYVNTNGYSYGSIYLTNGIFGENSMYFTAAGTLNHIFNPGDLLPLTQYPAFTLSIWVNAPPLDPANAGNRFFTMGNTASTDPYFSLANPDTTAIGDGSLSTMRGFFRDDQGQNASGDGDSIGSIPIYTASSPFVYSAANWHHVVVVQRVVGGALPTLQMLVYVDGTNDPGDDLATPWCPRGPITTEIMAIGGAVRNTTTETGTAGRGDLLTGAVDDVAVWNRDLTLAEIQLLQTELAPLAPATTPALAITSFRPDFAEVAGGDSATLRWTVSPSASGVSINGSSVISQTTNGLGVLTVTNITAATNFTLTISHGTNSLTSDTGVTVVPGVAAGWHILDDFQTYAVGSFDNAAPYWNNDYNGGAAVALITNATDPTTLLPTTKNMLDIPGDGGDGTVGLLELNSLDISPGQARTVFARVYVANDPASSPPTFTFGVTELALKSFEDIETDAGSMARLYSDPNGDLAVGAETTTNETENLFPCKLAYEQVYDLWIDVTNGGETITDTSTNVDVWFSIWLQREGDPNRFEVLSNYLTDQTGQKTFYGNFSTTISEFLVGTGGGTSTGGTLWLTDAYISKSGYNSTIPIPWTAWPASDIPQLATPTGFTYDTTTYPGFLNFTWTPGPGGSQGVGGALMSGPTLEGPWSVLLGPSTNGEGGFNDQEPLTNTTGNQFYFIWQ